MFYETKDGKKLAGKPTEFLTMIPTDLQRRHARHPARPGRWTRQGGRSWKDCSIRNTRARPRCSIRAGRASSTSHGARGARRLQVRRQGHMTKEEIDKDHQDHDRSRKGGHSARSGAPSTVGDLMASGEAVIPADVVAGRHRRSLARHDCYTMPLRRLSRLVCRAGADGASQRLKLNCATST